MPDQFDVSLEDSDLLGEVELTTNLIIAASETDEHLTDAEISLLQILAEQPGLAVSRHQLGERSRISGSERAVDTQIARLRRKLEPEPRQPRYLLTKRGEGYVLRPSG